MFHVTIEITSKVELFGWLSITAYALFAVPQLRERSLLYDPASASAAALARFVRWFDWLARFEVRPRAAGDGSSIAVIDRDGSTASGPAGVALLARAIPVLFPLSVPLYVLAKLFGRRGQAPTKANFAK
jgi:hypothetical protein